MTGFPNDGYSGDTSPEDRLSAEAEEYMRQGRYQDAVARYHDLRSMQPTDLWVRLGHASALECAGRTQEAERVMDEAVDLHRSNLHLQRFRRLFFERREDHARARLVREAIQTAQSLDEGPVDQLAELFFNQGRYHEALGEFQRILREEGIDEPAVKSSVLARLGACLRQSGRLEEAREHLLGSLGLESGSHWTLAELAETERAAGNVDAARRHYIEALTANPDDHWCRGHLAQLEHDEGDSDRAVALYEQILIGEPKAVWARVELAQVLSAADPERARRLCEEVLELDATYPWAWAHLGILSRARGDIEQAREHLRTALSHSPNAVWILHELADTCRQMGRLEEAHTHLEHAQNLQPFDGTTYGYRADILRSEERFPEAIANLRKAVELDSHYTWAWRELAELHALDRNFAEAEAAYQEAQRLEPGEAINDGLKAFILRCADRREDALPYLLRAVEQQPTYLWAWRELIEHHLGSSRWNEAADCASRAAEVIGDQPHLLCLHAEARRHLGQREEARRLTDRAIELDDQQAQYWALRAELESDVDTERALAFAERASRLDGQVEYRALVAQLSAAAGRTEDAERSLRSLLRHDRCPAMAWHLAAELAHRADDQTRALELIKTGLERHPEHPRLRIALARLQLEQGDRRPLATLHQLIDDADALPWHDLAQLFAQHDDALGMQRCCERLQMEAGEDPRLQAQAWTFRAELELGLGNPALARRAAQQALEQRPDHPPALLLAAMLAQREEDGETAGRHLARLDELLAERDEPADELATCYRQMAQIHDVRRDGAAAGHCWTRAEALDSGLDSRTEHARSLLRQGRAAEAAVLYQELLVATGTPEERDSERQTELLRELAQASFAAGGETAAIAELARREQTLSPDNRLLLAQLHLASGAVDQAEAALDGCGELAQRRNGILLRAQCRLATLRIGEAADLARPLWRDRPDDEDAATILAEALALDGALEDARDLVHHQALPGQMAAPRALLAVCLALELADEETALCLAAAQQSLRGLDRPLARVFATAWPGWQGADTRASLHDLQALPPFPRAVERIADALTRRGHGDLAVELLLMAAASLAKRGLPASAEHLHARAWPLLLRLGRRRSALCAARASGRLWPVLRCLLPW